MIGSYRNRHGSGDPAAEGPSGGGGAGRPASELQLQVQSQQEELGQLRKDLSSQKVAAPLAGVPAPQRLRGGRPQSLVSRV